MTDDKDRRLLLSLLSIFYNEEIQQDDYRLAPGDLYYIPTYGTYQVLKFYMGDNVSLLVKVKLWTRAGAS